MYTNGLFAPMKYGGTISTDCIHYESDGCSKCGGFYCGWCRYYVKCDNE